MGLSTARRAPETTLQTSEADWRRKAACASPDVNPEIFFPEGGGQAREARKICGGCDVKVECLTEALQHGERHGIWGSLGRGERRALRRRFLGAADVDDVDDLDDMDDAEEVAA